MQSQFCDDACDYLSLKSMDSPQNGLEPHSGVTLFVSIDFNESYARWCLVKMGPYKRVARYINTGPVKIGKKKMQSIRFHVPWAFLNPILGSATVATMEQYNIKFRMKSLP